MSWNPYAYLGAEPVVREHRRGEGPVRGARGGVRDHRVPVTTPPLRPREPDRRVTTRPEDLHPEVPPTHDHRPHRRHHFHDVPPWPQQRYRDYVWVEGGGWWPRWYPYWDLGWYSYWWYLYDYYGGDAYPEYAEYARDAVIRQYAPQWGLVVSGSPTTAVGIQPYGVPHAVERYSPRGFGSQAQIASYRELALDAGRKIYRATRQVLFGYRDSPWGSEAIVFGTRAGLQRWANEQAQDTDVWYAATFDLGQSATPLSEVAR